jgi:hypothetical protein
LHGLRKTDGRGGAIVIPGSGSTTGLIGTASSCCGPGAG